MALTIPAAADAAMYSDAQPRFGDDHSERSRSPDRGAEVEGAAPTPTAFDLLLDKISGKLPVEVKHRVRTTMKEYADKVHLKLKHMEYRTKDEEHLELLKQHKNPAGMKPWKYDENAKKWKNIFRR